MAAEFVRVALDVPLAGPFDYWAPGVRPDDHGRRVVVPFGNRRLVGVIVGVADAPAEAGRVIKPVEAILRDMPPLPAEVLELAQFCADYYHHPLGQVLVNALPVRFRDPTPWRAASALYYRAVDAAALCAQLPARAVAQQRLAHRLAQACDEASLRAITPQAMRWVRAWHAAGWVEAVAPPQPTLTPADGPPLNADQAAALAALRSTQGFQPWLLYGVTGSGKTEVYLRAIADVLAAGGQVLVLVPEINLTPQLEARFRARFPGVALACLHSSVADGERAAAWVEAAAGRARIVLGTRLAVFTPLPALGLIVVDEEHDASFKQQEGLRYSARDLAIWRARQRDVPVLLGSATPSLESWQHAESGRYRRLTLAGRAVAGAQPPVLTLVSLQRQPVEDGLAAASIDAISRTLARGEQVLVFLNRRGYAPVLHCHACGWMAACTRCSARLTLHLRARRLRCHHCGLEQVPPLRCPACGNADLQPVGQGTQRIEDVLARRFPHVRLLRIDRDSTQRKGSFAAALEDIHAGRADLLIGTQMLAKGHDFPRLTLVVVVGADSGLYATDFRAAERLYALLVQVAGRAGRASHPGQVLIQTAFPEHPFYAALVRDDYAAFARLECIERRRAGFPPFVHQALLRADAPGVEAALAWLDAARSTLPETADVQVFDPVPAVMLRVNGRERAQLLLQSTNRRALQALLAVWMPTLRTLKPGVVRWSLDVDPIDL